MLRRFTLVLVAVLACGAGLSISRLRSRRPSVQSIRQEQSPAPALRPDQLVKKDNRIIYKGISLTLDPVLASNIKAETVPRSSSLDDEAFKCDGIQSEHVLLTLQGPYAESLKMKGLTGEGEIEVYKIADYEKDLKLISPTVREPIMLLKQILAKQPNAAVLEKLLDNRRADNGSVPFLPCYDAGQSFHSRITYVPFKNGKAVFFLTQWNTETSPITNEGLSYSFQGITDDGQFAVSADFRVTAPFLPDGSEPVVMKWSEKNYLRPHRSRQYQSYIRPVLSKLEALPADQFGPSLLLFEQLVRSLEIRAE